MFKQESILATQHIFTSSGVVAISKDAFACLCPQPYHTTLMHFNRISCTYLQ